MSTNTPNHSSFRFVLSWSFRIFLNLVGFFGIALILYELLAGYFKSRWPLLDSVAAYISALLTLFGTLCTAASIYFRSEETTPPEKMSVFVGAPIIIAGCIIAILCLIWRGNLPAHVVNGFALIAIAGALLRIQPHPVRDSNLFWKRKPRNSPRDHNAG